ncbi:MAG: hypothetical protein WBP79_06185 [Candidatus Acidiferrales bacterium]
MTGWQKTLALGLSMIAVSAVLFFVFGKLPRRNASANVPKPWNTDAIKCTFVGIQVREIDATNAAVVFFYDLQNNTDFDYHVGNEPNIYFMSRLKSDGSLSSDKQIKLDHAAFVPARNRTRIGLEISRPFAWPGQAGNASEEKLRELVNHEVANLDGFTMFDNASRFQIELPGGWQEPPQVSSPAKSN